MPVRGREFTGAARAAGGILLALGALLVLARREHRWGDFALLLVLALPAAGLFALALTGAGGATDSRAEAWRSVLMVTAVLLSGAALFQFLSWIGANTSHLLYDAAVFLVVALIAFSGAGRARAPYVMFLAGLALLTAWMLVWIKILGGSPSGSEVRWLLLGGGVALMLASGVADIADATGAGELATAGAIGAVAAGILGVFIGAVRAAFEGLSLITSSPGGPAARRPGLLEHASRISGEQTTGWDIYLLAVSVALIWLASRSGRRGPGYAGALGLLLFIASTVAQLTRVENGHAPSQSLLGWPLVLVVLGLAGLAAPLLRRREER
ncbi:MAG TPA: hypothetical protein VIB59_00345 [Solirubrobacteraceae bacterium]